jgi:hypothetical protein
MSGKAVLLTYGGYWRFVDLRLAFVFMLNKKTTGFPKRIVYIEAYDTKIMCTR